MDIPARRLIVNIIFACHVIPIRRLVLIGGAYVFFHRRTWRKIEISSVSG